MSSWELFVCLLRKEGHILLWLVQFRLVAATNLMISVLYGSGKQSSCGEASLYFCASQRYPRVLPSVLVWYYCWSPLDALRRGPSFKKHQNDLPQNFWNWNHVRLHEVKLCVAYIVIFFRKYLLGPIYVSEFGYRLLLRERKKKHCLWKLLCDWICCAWCYFRSAKLSGLITGSKSLFIWIHKRPLLQM
jgi:hypothetical protein